MFRTVVLCAVLGFFTAPASAGPITQGRIVPENTAGAVVDVPVDGTWVGLEEVMQEGWYYSPIFSYTTSLPSIQIDVTDFLVVSDRNEVWLGPPGATLVGATPAVSDWPALSPPVGPFDDPPWTDDPQTAWGRPEFSKASFVLPGNGTYYFRLKNIHIPPTEGGQPFDTGSVAFRLVPEPSTLLASLPVLVWLLRRRRAPLATRPCGGARRHWRKSAAAAIAIGVGAASAQAGFSGQVGGQAARTANSQQAPTFPRGSCALPFGCAGVSASVSGGALEVDLGLAHTIRLRKSGDCIELYVPAVALAACASFDSGAAPGFDTIRVTGTAQTDIILFDDTNGVISNEFTIEVDADDGADVVVGGVDLGIGPDQGNAAIQQLLDDLDDFRAAVESGALATGAEDLIAASFPVLEAANSTLIQPGIGCATDVRTALIEPMRAVVLEAVDQEILAWVDQVADDAQAIQAQAEALEHDINDNLISIQDIMVPVAWDLVAAGQVLYEHALQFGMEPQSGDPNVLVETIENYIQSIEFWANMCVDPDQTGCPDPNNPNCDPAAGNEDAQDPNGLPYPCDELEILVEQLEALIDSVEQHTDGVEAEADALEASADEESGGSGALEGLGDALEATADGIEGDIETMESDAETFEADSEQRAADQEQWAADKQAALQAGGDQMEACLQSLSDAADALEAQAQADIVALAEQLRSDVEAVLVLSSTIETLMGEPQLSPAGGACPVLNTPHTIKGGPGNDILVGTTGNDLIEGGDDADLIIGGAGNDVLKGEKGWDLVFGGGGVNELHGGDDPDLLVGGNSADCIFGGDHTDLAFGRGGDDRIHGEQKADVLFGGGSSDHMFGGDGETRTLLGVSFELGNLFFGDLFSEQGDDTIVGGDEDPNDPNNPVLKPGIDIVFAGPKNDTILVGDGGAMDTTSSPSPFPIMLGNLVFGGTGDDEIVARDGIDVLFGGGGDDTIEAGKGHRFVFDSNDNGTPEFEIPFGDLIFGQTGQDVIHGDDSDPNADPNDYDIDLIFSGLDGDEVHGYDGGLLEFDSDEDNENEFELCLGNLVFTSGGDDTVETGKGIDLIFTSAGNDTIEAGYGCRLKFSDAVVMDFGDLIFAGDGDDVIHGDRKTAPASADPNEGEVDGIDLIFCGGGNDTSYSCDGGLFVVGDIDDPTSITLAFTFGNLVFGGPGDDVLRAKYENPSTGGGDDDARPGIDFIFSGPENDEIVAGAGSTIFIKAGPTIIPFGNLLFGGPGDDVIKGANEAPLPDVDLPIDPNAIPVPGGSLAEYLEGMDLIFAGPGDDTVESYNGIDLIFGGDGMDELVAEHGGVLVIAAVPIPFGNLIFGGDDEDTIESQGRTLLLECDLLFGGLCDDVISAGGGLLNLAFGNRHDDTIDAGGESVTVNLLFGNRGNDTITTTGVGVNLLFGNRDDDDITAGLGLNVAFGNRGDDTVNGGSGVNLLFGNRGDDTIAGGADNLGVYLLFGNRGSDNVLGGGGLNLAFGNRCADVVQGGPGVNLLFGNRGEDEIVGGAGLTLAFGNRENDRLSSGTGLTLLFGNSGNDRLVAGGGLDLPFGNRGNDVICGGSGLTIAFGNRDSDVILGGSAVNILFGNADNDWIAGGNGALDIIFANGGDDTIYGRGGSLDLLFGNNGNDDIDGEGGKDFAFGNRGNDRLMTGNDRDFYFGNRGDDLVYSRSDDSDNDFLFGNRGNDTLDGWNCDKRYGGRGNNSKSCNGSALTFSEPDPRHGIIRGRVRIDTDGNGSGDVGHGGVTVTLTGPSGPLSTTTNSDPNDDCASDVGGYSFTGLKPGTYTICETVPSGYSQTSPGSCHSVTIAADCGGGIVTGVDFVNRAECAPAADGLSCDSAGCAAGECRPTYVRAVKRCAATGELCDTTKDCECGDDCLPSWEVVQCECNPTCYIELDPVLGPVCAGDCPSGCELIVEGDLYHCECLGLPNDNCDGAIGIACNSPVIADNSLATTDPNDPGFSCFWDGSGSQGDGTLWYKFVATADCVHIQTCNTNVPGLQDTLIALYEGPCSNLVEVACGEDECEPYLSRLTAAVSAGHEYYIQVATNDDFSSRGPILLEVECFPCPPPSACNGTEDIDEAALEPDCGMPVDTVNGGCGSNPPVFTDVACGNTICGGHGCGAGCDTDWYRLTSMVNAGSTTIWSGVSTREWQAAIIEDDGACGQVSIVALASFPPGPFSVTYTWPNPPTAVYLWVAAPFGIPFPCEEAYTARVGCDQ